MNHDDHGWCVGFQLSSSGLVVINFRLQESGYHNFPGGQLNTPRNPGLVVPVVGGDGCLGVGCSCQCLAQCGRVVQVHTPAAPASQDP